MLERWARTVFSVTHSMRASCVSEWPSATRFTIARSRRVRPGASTGGRSGWGAGTVVGRKNECSNAWRDGGRQVAGVGRLADERVGAGVERGGDGLVAVRVREHDDLQLRQREPRAANEVAAVDVAREHPQARDEQLRPEPVEARERGRRRHRLEAHVEARLVEDADDAVEPERLAVHHHRRPPAALADVRVCRHERVGFLVL